ncbi:MAG: hypothetical protein IPI73_22680 [Betaproteobacteria bacterium]|nr:hypothetical protein [Betaproteobacteria bacterium]
MFAKLIVFSAALIITGMLDGVAHTQEIFRITLVGTGTPIAQVKRFGPATQVEAAVEQLLAV